MNKEHFAAQLFLRAWPFPRGSGRIADKLFSRLRFSQHLAEVMTTDGFKITVMPNDLVGRHIYLMGEFDRTVVEVLLRYAKPGDTLLDIGANIGYVSACFLTNIVRSRVVAVDPHPTIVDLLRKNLKQFGDRQAVVPVAISDSDGIREFFIDPLNSGASSLIGISRPEQDGNVVEVWSGEKLAQTLNQVDLIKIDVEGHETEVLHSLKPAILRFQPRAIVFEHHMDKAAPDKPIGLLLNSLGFGIFGIHKRLTKIDLVPVRSSADCRCSDYLAVPM